MHDAAAFKHPASNGEGEAQVLAVTRGQAAAATQGQGTDRNPNGDGGHDDDLDNMPPLGDPTELVKPLPNDPLELPGSSPPSKPTVPNWRPRSVRSERLFHRNAIDNASALSARLNLLKRLQIEDANKVYHGVKPFTLSKDKGYGFLSLLHAVTAKRPPA